LIKKNFDKYTGAPHKILRLTQMDQEALTSAMKDYGTLKEWFEREWAYVPHYDRYLFLTKTMLSVGIYMVTVPQFKLHFSFLRYTNADGAKKNFITRWLNDSNKKLYTEMNLLPCISDVPHIYNVWSGYAAEKLPPVNDDLIVELVQPIWDHLSDVVTGANERHTEFIMDFLANIIQNPKQKATEAIQLCGENERCKYIIIDFFREKVLGELCTLRRSISSFRRAEHFPLEPKVFLQARISFWLLLFFMKYL
jgi:hypothetical protein